MSQNLHNDVDASNLQHILLDLRMRERELALLKATVSAINSQLDLDTVFKLVAARARELIGAETLLIPVLDADGQHYTYQAGSGRNTEEIVGERLPLDFGVCGWVWRHKRPWWRGALDELDSVERNRWEREAGTLILVPMVGKNNFLGGLAGINKIGGGDFTKQDLDLLSLFAGQVSIAIENAMAYEELDKAKQSAEGYQTELRQLNNELSSINQELERLALYDQLTQLPNRTLLNDRLQQALIVARRENQQAAVLIIDLDQFKEVNDTLGHDIGDQLLIKVAQRFSSRLRQTDTVGRLGGDEFAVVIPSADIELASQLANTMLAALEPDFNIDGMCFSVAASVGIAVYPIHGTDSSTLMKHADIAMYSAKRTRFGYTVYDAEDDVHQPERFRLFGDLRQALMNNDFELYYQPKLDLMTGTLKGVEALARLPHAVRGLIMPDQFIPLLEQTGLIRPFTLWAIERGLHQCVSWHAMGIPLSVAINLSIQSILDPQFPAQVLSLLQSYPLARNCLVLEITESIFLSDHTKVNAVFNELRSNGVNFSIDDFGTGHSSLSRLKKLPVSELKIDRSFVKDMEADNDDAIIVRSTIDLAHNLGLTVIAEGVENESTLTMLRGMGCNSAQGFFISRPLPIDEFNNYLKNAAWTIPHAL